MTKSSASLHRHMSGMLHFLGLAGGGGSAGPKTSSVEEKDRKRIMLVGGDVWGNCPVFMVYYWFKLANIS